jgi:acyl carrier protein
MNIDTLNAAIAEEFEIETSAITPEASIKETLELDSLSLLDLVAVVERVTGTKVKGTELNQIQSFGDLYAFLEQCS